MLKKQDILANLKAPFKVKLLDRVASTNDIAARCAPYTAVFARCQRAGRGRDGHNFSSSRGGIYLSVALPKKDAAALTLKAGVAVVRAIRKTKGYDCRIKWVNDIFLAKKKICGILCENRADSEVTVAGIGINYCNRLPSSLKEAAAVLSESEEGMAELAAAVLDELFDALQREVIQEYKRLSLVLNRYVSARGIKYFVYDIDDDGALLVRDEAGIKQRLAAGEISVLPL